MPNLAALTFDDFPGEKIDELLELLDRWNATATFFINGPYDPSEPVLQERILGPRLQKIHNAGHQIASHTYDHVNLQTADAPAILNEMTLLDRWLAEVLGVTAPRFMRAPYGECNATCARTLTLAGYKVIGWGFDTEDWKYATPETVHRSIAKVHEYIGQFKERKIVDMAADIVLMHAFINTTVTTVAPAVLEAFSREGLRFVSVAECLGYPQEMWYR
ncbi:Polysaccharide deacetylase [Lasiodiplodia theobromae]|uniref:Peptidoglycan-N-acetylglucosamine deacetylase n=1 Tax=Lasiodiplodia hormozganensis TaxID=869390 RepID=A0AA39XR67_9PEZI|nr:Polysaccharide deacetylase [Lasiodiplodia theobromae]KAK0637635.1 putative peptidoglycan-N-acetylglucosamine deacetylase [Lasiodiplodia hormozganensis]